MNGFGPVAARRIQNAVDAQIALGGRRGPQVGGLIGHAHVQRGAVGIGIDGHRDDPHLAQRANDTDSDLAAVGNQDLMEHSQEL